jgi:3-(3-hydroxy-phenyl)propionate hydroxylase
MVHPKDLALPWRRSADQGARSTTGHPIVIVGAGPTGLTAALDLASKGHRAIVIEKRGGLSGGSRAICWSKRTLEVMDRLGVAQSLLDKGITWSKGKVFCDTRLLYEFDLLPEVDCRMPAFVNLQQYYFEHSCVAAALDSGAIDLRWQEQVTAIEQESDGVRLSIATPDGTYHIFANWLIAADGARSSVRALLGLDFKGRAFEDQFLICDVKMHVERPVERWFWFDPPFNRGRSALLHRQADDVWRLDFQIGDDADRDAAVRPENVAQRVRGMLGDDVDFTFEWISLYRFQSRRLDRFRHGRVLFAGDAAHQMSPFGARGGNSGVQDADNLAWKLDLVLRGLAPEAILESYDTERCFAADENLLNTTRSTDFIAPKGAISRAFRDGALALAATEPFARRFVNSGRLSVATSYGHSVLNGADEFAVAEAAAVRPGAAAQDTPLDDGGWLLKAIGGEFVGVYFICGEGPPEEVKRLHATLMRSEPPVRGMTVSGRAACARYGASLRPAYYLFRPDQHVAARWRTVTPDAVAAAAARAVARADHGRLACR